MANGNGNPIKVDPDDAVMRKKCIDICTHAPSFVVISPLMQVGTNVTIDINCCGVNRDVATKMIRAALEACERVTEEVRRELAKKRAERYRKADEGM